MIETLKKVPFIYLQKYFDNIDQEIYKTHFEKNWQLRKSPSFLGNFTYQMNKINYNNMDFPTLNLIDDLKRLVTEQEFNTLFTQRYEIGQEVKVHQDPMNNIGATIIAYFGEYTGATFHIEDISTKRQDYELDTHAGDVVIMRCNLNNLYRPRHWVTPIITGTKYSFILNTIR